jgi:hypothetical protein
MELAGVGWEGDGRRGRGIKLRYISHFDARGMSPVYGRGDHFGYGRTFNMDVWLTRTGRLLARFWSRSSEVDWEAYEIVGLSHSPVREKEMGLSEDWVPQRLRTQYDSWIISNF